MKNVKQKSVENVIKELDIGGEFNLDEINKVLDIITFGNKILRNENSDVENFENIKGLVINMINTLYQSGGCGLAAPQIGVNVNVFVIKVIGTDENKNDYTEFPLTVFINPKIIEYSEEKENDYEGCLSMDNYYAMVERSKKITIEYTDLFGKKHIDKYEDFNARVVQHEYDHLKGILFTDICNALTLTTKDNLILNSDE